VERAGDGCPEEQQPGAVKRKATDTVLSEVGADGLHNMIRRCKGSGLPLRQIEKDNKFRRKLIPKTGILISAPQFMRQNAKN
jgi:hypothetical protein